MKFKIPFTFSSTEILKKRAKNWTRFIRIGKNNFSKLQQNLKNIDSGLDKREYLAICLKTFIFSFLMFAIIFSTVLFFLKVGKFYLISLGGAFIFSFFLVFNQMGYPRVYSLKKTRDIEKNLLPALQDIMVQLNSGVPVFDILTNVSRSDYGAVSSEFGKAVMAINSGKPQIEAVEGIGERSTSIYFKRAIWHISNGMRAGSDMAIVIKDSIDNLAKEQVIQIQTYGSKLNPLIMFYMLLTVIIPALGITFLTIISSMVGLPANSVRLMFFGVFAFVVFIQVMFLGIIKSRRPSLL